MGVIAFTSARRRESKIVAQRWRMLPGDVPAYCVTVRCLERLPLMLGTEISDVTIVLCRGYGLIHDVAGTLRSYAKMGAKVVDEWQLPMGRVHRG